MIRFTGEEIAGWTNDALIKGKFGRVATKKGRVFEGWLFIEWQTMPPVLFVNLEDFSAPKPNQPWEHRPGEFTGEIHVEIEAIKDIILLPCPDCGMTPDEPKCRCPF
jgi:hypothetical protein